MAQLLPLLMRESDRKNQFKIVAYIWCELWEEKGAVKGGGGDAGRRGCREEGMQGGGDAGRRECGDGGGG